MLCSSPDSRFVGCVAVPSRADVVTVLRVATARQMRGERSFDARRCLAHGSALRPRIERARDRRCARVGAAGRGFLAWKSTKKKARSLFRHVARFPNTFLFFASCVPLALVVIPSLRASPTKRFCPSRSRSARRSRGLLLALELDTPTHDDPDDHPEQTERASEDLDHQDLHEERRVLRVGQRARRSDGADADSAD